MNKKDFEVLFEFNRWANRETLGAVAALTPDELNKDLANSFSSVRETLVHILAAEWIWLERWKGTSPKSLFDPAEFPTLDSIRTRWAEVERGQIELLEGLTDESLAASVAYVNARGRWEYPLGQMMQHVVNHSSYHRGQVTTMLRQLGADAVSTDFLVFIDARSA